MNNDELATVQAGFEADEKSYWKMRPDLLMKYPGRWVAVHKGRVVAVGEDLISIVGEATREDGYAYTNKVGDEDKIIVRKRRRKLVYFAQVEIGVGSFHAIFCLFTKLKPDAFLHFSRRPKPSLRPEQSAF